MAEALIEARAAATEGEVPIGSVVVAEGRIVGRGRNAREGRAEPTGPAGGFADLDAARAAGRQAVIVAQVYAGVGSCPMCAGALGGARVGRLVYEVPDRKAGALGPGFVNVRD